MIEQSKVERADPKKSELIMRRSGLAAYVHMGLAGEAVKVEDKTSGTDPVPELTYNGTSMHPGHIVPISIDTDHRKERTALIQRRQTS